MRLQGKLIITATLELLTGLHIGASSDFAPIGAVDSVLIRDPLKKQPIIPGSSLKGKLRTLLASIETESYKLKDIEEDSAILKRLFGSSKKNEAQPSRLQFYDVFMEASSVERIANANTDLYLTEVKFENTINRTTCVANPRQIERVPAGAKFNFKLNYNVETVEEVMEDLEKLGMAFQLLQLDYLGGHGSRGYGKVAFSDFKLEILDVSADKGLNSKLDKVAMENLLAGK